MAQGTDLTFPNVLAAEVAKLTKRLLEAELAKSADELSQLRAENARLLARLADFGACNGLTQLHDNEADLETGGIAKAPEQKAQPTRQQPPTPVQGDGRPSSDPSHVWQAGAQLPTNYASEGTDSSAAALKSSVTNSSVLMASTTVTTEQMEALTPRNDVETFDLKQHFKHLDKDRKGFIHANDLANSLHLQFADEVKQERVLELVEAVNSLVDGDTGIQGLSPDQMSFDAFRAMILQEDLPSKMKDHLAELLNDIRVSFIEDQTKSKIAQLAQVSFSDLVSELGGKDQKGHLWLGPFVSIHIILNAIVIGVSIDTHPDWNGWGWLEAYFTCIFLFEMVFKICITSCKEHFTGSEWLWNMFDFIIVVLAVMDLMSTVMNYLFDADLTLDFNNVTIIRLARLLRIARVVRLLRYPIFRELALMVNGAINGMRTLVWAMLLLFVLVYVLGVVMRQVVMTFPVACVMPPELANTGNMTAASGDTGNMTGASGDEQICTWQEATLKQYGDVLFGSVSRSMFTVFQCFTEGCSNPNGTPMIWTMWHHFGPLLVCGYTITFLFVTFGIFNLIMAIFVENTMEYARHNDARRNALAYQQHIKVANQLQQLVYHICSGEEPAERISEKMKHLENSSENSQGLLQTVKSVRNFFRRGKTSQIDLDHQKIPSHMRVTRRAFEDAMLDTEVQRLLDELDIAISSRDKLFDILDSDGNGYIAVTELVDGFMRLRGPADKGDVVSASLILRSIQKSLRKFELVALHNDEVLKASLRDLQLTMPTHDDGKLAL